MKCSVLLSLFVTIGLVTAAPNTVSKAVSVETQFVPKVALGAGGVSASWGGYSASAGLGGEVGSAKAGGLYAAADSPHGSAAAGLGGSVDGSAQGGLFAGAEYSKDIAAVAKVGGHVDESVGESIPVKVPQDNVIIPEAGGAIGGAVNGGFDTTVNSGSSAGAGIGGGVYVTKGVHTTKVVQTQPGFFDRIFNIPISVLQAVNAHLNTKEGSTVRVITNEELKNLSQHLAVQGIPVNAETLRLMRWTQRKEEKRAARRAKKGRSAGHNLQGLPVKRVYVQSGGSVSGTSGHAAGTGYGEVPPPPVPATAGLAEVSGSAHAYGAGEAGGGLKVATYETKPDLGTQVAGGGSAEGVFVVQKPVRNYDQIFNIPISALKSVNQLLNG